MAESLKMVDGKVDEEWLDRVLKENAERSRKGLPLTEDFGKCCIRFTDALICNSRYGFCRLDKLTKAEVCSRVYLHMCKQVGKYDDTKRVHPSSWLITMAKNRITHAIREVLNDDKVSTIVACVIGNETLGKLDGIDRNAPLNQILSERIGALSEFKLNQNAKENIFGQVWRGNWFKRDGKTLVRRARHHRRLQALKVAKQVELCSEQRDELSKLLQERHDGK